MIGFRLVQYSLQASARPFFLSDYSWQSQPSKEKEEASGHLAECWWWKALHLVCGDSLVGSSHLYHCLLRVLTYGAFEVTFCVALSVDIPTRMCFLPFTRRPISSLPWHWSFFRLHRSGWQVNFCAHKLPELLLSPWKTHTPLSHHRMVTWAIPRHLLLVSHLYWLSWSTSVHYWPSRGLQMRHQPYLSEWFFQESLGGFSDRLLPQHWKVPQTLTSPKRASLTSPSPFNVSSWQRSQIRSGLLKSVSSNTWQIPHRPGYGQSILFVLGSHDGMAGWGWGVMTMKEKEQNPDSGVIAICDMWYAAPFHIPALSISYYSHYGHRLIMVMDSILKIF